MRVDGKISAGYAIVCDCGAAFAVERLGVAVECPTCGHTELGVDVAVEYYLNRSRRKQVDDGQGALSEAAG